jgi:cardiolipin synthase
MWDFFTSPWVALLVERIASISLVIRVLLQRRAVSVALAWMILLLLAPLVGIFAYLLVGENRLGSRRLAKFLRVTEGIDRQVTELWRLREDEWRPADAAWEQIARLATAVSGLPPLKGNSLQLIAKAEDLLDALVQDIDGASRHCHLLFYIYTTTPRCLPVSEALKRAAARGVACRLLVDAVGSKKFLRGQVCRELRAAGVKVVAALPANPLRMLFSRIDLRNHRKIVVIDGKIAYTGSQNLTDSTFRAGWNQRRVGPWIDASVRLVGPATDVLQTIFLKDWSSDSAEEVGDIRPFLGKLSEPADQSQVVQVVPSGPGVVPGGLQQALLTTIYSAREELVLTTPYFVPDDATRKALMAASLRGVRVTLVMPREVNSPLVAAASRAQWLDLLESGVRIMLYRGGLLHAKTLTVDRRIGVIGSANFDMRSFWLNFEITLILYDDDFASVLRFMQVGYLDNAEEVSLDAWRARSRGRVLLDNIAQLLGPIL